jgi:hypothetical protein
VSAPAETATETTKRVGLPIRVLGAVALAAIGFGLIVTAAATDGYGTDMHALRVAATLGVLVSAMLVLVWPDRRPTTRAAAVCVALVGGSVMWWWVPSGFGGRSLSDAWAEGNMIQARLALLTTEDLTSLPGTRDRLESLAADYPTLSRKARATVDRWIKGAVGGRVEELRELSAADAATFTATAPGRRALAEAVPDARERLVEAEEKWAARWARFTAVGYTHADMSAKHIREACRECEQQLLALPCLDETDGRLLEARRVFFRAAHASAVNEIAGLHEAQKFERAFGVALTQSFEWSATRGLLGPEDQKELDELRERCRALLRSGGDPEEIAPPRAIETGPQPRPK